LPIEALRLRRGRAWEVASNAPDPVHPAGDAVLIKDKVVPAFADRPGGACIAG